MKLSKLFQDIKLERRLRMIDESPASLRSMHEKIILSSYLQKVRERKENHQFLRYSQMMDQEEIMLAYDCSIDELFQSNAVDSKAQRSPSQFDNTTSPSRRSSPIKTYRAQSQMTRNNNGLYNQYASATVKNNKKQILTNNDGLLHARNQSLFSNKNNQNHSNDNTTKSKKLQELDDIQSVYLDDSFSTGLGILTNKKQLIKPNKAIINRKSRNPPNNTKNTLESLNQSNISLKSTTIGNQSQLNNAYRNEDEGNNSQTRISFANMMDQSDINSKRQTQNSFTSQRRGAILNIKLGESPTRKDPNKLSNLGKLRGLKDWITNEIEQENKRKEELEKLKNQETSTLLRKQTTLKRKQTWTSQTSQNPIRPKSAAMKLNTKQYDQKNRKIFSRKANLKKEQHFKADFDVVPAMYPKGCLTCGGRNQHVQYHGDRHICSRCAKSLQSADGSNKFVDVFLSKSGQIVVIKKQSQNDDSTKMLYMKEENYLFERLKQEQLQIQLNKQTLINQKDKENHQKHTHKMDNKQYQVEQIQKKGNMLLPQSKHFEYGDYMNLKIYSLECYAALAGDGNLVILLKDN
eukprot:403348592